MSSSNLIDKLSAFRLQHQYFQLTIYIQWRAQFPQSFFDENCSYSCSWPNCAMFSPVLAVFLDGSCPSLGRVLEHLSRVNEYNETSPFLEFFRSSNIGFEIFHDKVLLYQT
jgi:hypothetical protein